MSGRELITERLDLWTGAVTKKSSSGRGSNGKIELTGIKKLRELILELAVHGKLVDQDPGDTAASELLSRITDIRKDLIIGNKIKNSKPLPPVLHEEAPSRLSDGWAWTRLGTIAEINPRNTAADLTEASFIPMPLVTTSYHGEHGDESRAWGEIKKGYSHFADGDIGLAKITPCFENSKAAVFRSLRNGVGAGTTELHVARPLSTAINPYFILLFLKSPKFLAEGKKVMTGSAGQKRVPKDYFAQTPLPLPPEDEQYRIVQKVDELMALCDRLEQQTSNQLEAHETLVDTLLGTLAQSQNATELADNWTRLAAHFDTLFITEQSIDKIKQTILQLAVMGRLVEQDAGDEPASEFMKRLEITQQELSSESKQRKTKPLPPIEESEGPFRLPPGWFLSRLDDITDIQGGIAKGKKLSDKKMRSLPYLRVANVQRSSLDLSEIKDIEIAENEVERYLVHPRDLLITEGGDWDKVGRTAIWDGSINPMAHQNHVFRARLIMDEQNERWFEKYLNSQFARDYFAGSSKQTTNLASINKTQLRSCTIPLPPLEEQARIVDKFDELMVFCDQLKECLSQANKTRSQLAEAVVEQAIS
ncbi:restriction endonuclease subunit S [Marinobacter gelidimuriae]|uniref:restriction endonuclease subunit S n=1 Tax=Marinobacter gelidimuriae TaxID=2739064 RepID=UPI000366C606|nr:restriction endonuclease subunit S [Marinobacter gelidimuriae]